MVDNGERRIDVLQVITTSARRGAERFAVDLEGELRACGFVVETVALMAGRPPTLDVEALGSDRLGRATLRQLRRRGSVARLVIAHGSTTLPACAIALVGTGTPFVYRNIGDPAFWSPDRMRRLRSRLLLGRAERVAALTELTKERIGEYYSVPADKIEVIPRGVSSATFPPRTAEKHEAGRRRFDVDDNVRLAIVVGSLSSEKDVGMAIRAVGDLPGRWHLLVAGDGPDRPALERLAADVAPGRVRFLGQMEQTAALYQSADLLLLSSLTEGLPGVVIEAAMTGVPAVVTDVGFVRSIVEDGTTGRIVPTSEFRAMAAAVLDVEDHLEEMGLAAQSHVAERFSLESTAAKWADLIRSVPGFSSSERGAPA